MKLKILILCFLFIPMLINASIVVMDADSKRVLYESNAHEEKLIASTTKIMTAIVALEYGDINSKFIVGEEINLVNGSMIYAKIGEEFSLKDLLYGLLLVSGNDAANIIATNIYGYDEFVYLMNQKAKMIGMNDTTFENPHGLNDDSKNHSSAYDLALLMRYAINNKTFLHISSTKKYKLKTNINEYIWYNKNKLLDIYKYSTAGKIGYTKASGQVFVSSASKDNKNLIITSIDESNKFILHKNLYEKYFNIYEKYKIIDKYSFSLNNSKYKKYFMYINNDISVLIKENEINKLNIKVKINEKFKNNIAGSLNVYLDNELICKEKLYYIYYYEKINKFKSLLSFFK